MCIILSCDPHCRPDAETLRRCWDSNPDGGGVMWCEGGKVEIVKGLMTFRDLLAAVDYAPDDSPLVVHMRIGTSGGYGAEVTHPYPITSKIDALHALDVESTYGIAHNGVLPYPTDDAAGISDTVYYVQHVVAKIATKKSVRKRGGICQCHTAKRRLADTSKGSRLALLDYMGNVLLVGHGWQTVTTGIQASNGTWRTPRWGRYYSFLDDADDDGDALAWDDDGLPYYSDSCKWCDAWDDCKSWGPMCLSDARW